MALCVMASQTPARLRGAHADAFGEHDCRCAASASALPERMPISAQPSELDHGQPPECLPYRDSCSGPTDRRRRGDGIFWRHSAGDPPMQSCWFDAMPACGLRQRHHIAGKLDPPIPARVICLPIPCRPFDIPSPVALAVVDSLQGVLRRWALSKVCEEIDEARPASADGDAAPAIAWIRGVGGIAAPAEHVSPGAIFGGVRPSVVCEFGGRHSHNCIRSSE